VKSDDDENDGSTRTYILIGILALVGVIALTMVVCYLFSGTGGANVSGKVTLDGVTVDSGLVVFMGADGKNEAPVTAPIENGNYRLVGNQGGGVPIGKYKVAVTREALKNGTVPTGEKLEQARSKGLLINVLPKIYESHADTPLQFELRSGSQTINLEMKKKQ
jgi:hypothetical protein